MSCGPGITELPDVSRETSDALQAFEALVRRWNPAINLVSKASLFCLPHFLDRHKAQLLRPLALLLPYDTANDQKRDKATNPHYSKNCERCLYGLHLYDKAKPAIIVESEKTAQALGLYFDSQYNFLATGGANGAKKEHLLPLIGNEIYYFADNDII
jgi:hypothetical protein